MFHSLAITHTKAPEEKSMHIVAGYSLSQRDYKDSWTTFSQSLYSPAGKKFRGEDKDRHWKTSFSSKGVEFVCAGVMKSKQSMTECVSLCILNTWTMVSIVMLSNHKHHTQIPRSSAELPKAHNSSVAHSVLETVVRESFKQIFVTLSESHSLCHTDPHYIWPTIQLQSWVASLNGSDLVSDFSELHLLPYLKGLSKVKFIYKSQNHTSVSEDFTICAIIPARWQPVLRSTELHSFIMNRHTIGAVCTAKIVAAAVQLQVWVNKILSAI